MRRWSALAVGFIGVIVILRPGVEALDPYALLIVFSAMTGGMNVVTVKFLARTESPTAIVTYLMLFLTPLSLIPALFVWQWPSLVAIAWLVNPPMNAVSPGAVRTPMLALSGAPPEPALEPAEVAGVVAWLAGPESAPLSGANLRVDPGLP